ncbi:hypothetical protein N0V91_006684 [Didymella pomorum]|uniref:Uncharacterized protein n=1 Tax=Didymella pomorum TaxID=749634 RepID=A0A9W8ZA19_9PLEO|nr:hypothetical protein N0V91_006684 [Didymella pomorum]
MHWQVAQNSFEVQGAHLILVLYICALSSSSHLAALINLRKYFRKYKFIAKIPAIGMPPTVTSQESAINKESSRAQRLAFLVPMLFILVGF